MSWRNVEIQFAGEVVSFVMFSLSEVICFWRGANGPIKGKDGEGFERRIFGSNDWKIKSPHL